MTVNILGRNLNLKPFIQDVSREGSSTKAYPNYILKSRTHTPYAWDFPAAREKRLLLTINDTHRIVDIMEIGDLVPFKFPVCGWIDFWMNSAHSGFSTINAQKQCHLMFALMVINKCCESPITIPTGVYTNREL